MVKTGVTLIRRLNWIPAFAGMTEWKVNPDLQAVSVGLLGTLCFAQPTAAHSWVGWAKCSVPNIARSEVGLLGTLRFRASPDFAQPTAAFCRRNPTWPRWSRVTAQKTRLTRSTVPP